MKISNEAKIGVMIFGVVVLLIIMTVKTGNFNFSKKGYEVKVYFETIDGVKVNAPVLLNGLEVGLVKDIKINYGEDKSTMELVLWLEEWAKLREGAKAHVKNMGFMGEKYVGLTFGNSTGAFLPAGTIIEGVTPADFDKLVSDGQEIAAQLKEISMNLNERLEKNKEAIDTTISNLASITSNVDERLKVNQEHIDDIVTHLQSVSVNLDELSYDLKTNPWKLLYRPKSK